MTAPGTDATRLTVVLMGSDQHDPDHEPLENELYIEVSTPEQLALMHHALMHGLTVIQASAEGEGNP